MTAAASETGAPRTTPFDLDEHCAVVRGEFLEMPALRLTAAQAQRLWHLEQDACAAVLAKLVRTGFLSEKQGTFACRDRASGFRSGRSVTPSRPPTPAP